MAYTPIGFVDGDYLNANDLNHIESGIVDLQDNGVHYMYSASLSTGAGSTGGGLNLRRIGNTVFATGQITHTTGFSTSDTEAVTDVPVGYRPVMGLARSGDIRYYTNSATVSTYVTGRITVDTSGNVLCAPPSSGLTGAYINAVWLTNDAYPA